MFAFLLIVLSVAGISAFALAALVLPGSFPYYLDLIHSLSFGPALITASKFAVSFPVAYHTFNGIRHLVSTYTSPSAKHPITAALSLYYLIFIKTYTHTYTYIHHHQ